MKKAIVVLIVVIMCLIVFFGCTQAQISAGITFQSGRIEQLNLNYDINLSHKDSTFEYKFFSKFRYSESTQVTNRDIRNGAGIDFKPFWVLSPFILAEYRINHFMDMSSKVNALTGIKYTFLNEPNYKYSISGAIIYEKVDFLSDIPDKEIARLSMRQKVKHDFGKFRLRLTVFYKPALNNYEDYDIEITSSLGYELTYKLSDHLKLSVQGNIENAADVSQKSRESFYGGMIYYFD